MSYLRESEFMMRFGERLKQLRISKNIPQKELALNSGLAISQVGRIERGELNTGISTICILANALGVHPKELLDFPFEIGNSSANKKP